MNDARKQISALSRTAQAPVADGVREALDGARDFIIGLGQAPEAEGWPRDAYVVERSFHMVADDLARRIFDELHSQVPLLDFGYAEADGGKTVLDGAYDLAKVAEVVIAAFKTESDTSNDARYRAALNQDGGA